eukprot:1692630-Prymnesium_polylepis.1
MVMRRTISFALVSSRWCPLGTSCTPMIWARVRIGGGPPSAESPLRKKRLTLNVEQGGAARMQRNSPIATRRINDWKKSSRSMSCSTLPQRLSLSTCTVVMPKGSR